MQPVALDSAPPVAVHGLAKRFHGADALRDVTFEVRPGEILGLLGANGAGKTTTLHMVLGLIRPNAGSVRLFGVDPQRDKRAALARVGFASPEAMMDWRLTVRENLRVYALLTGAIGLAGVVGVNLLGAAINATYTSWDTGVNNLWEVPAPQSTP